MCGGFSPYDLRQEFSQLHSESKQGEIWGVPGFACGPPLSIEDLIGVPYVEGGRDPARGLDCTGVVIEIFRRVEIDIVDPKDDPEGMADEWVEVDQCKKRVFDVFGFETKVPGYVDHYGVYLGFGLLVHAEKTRGVEVVALRDVEGNVLSILRLKRFAEC